MRELLVVSGKGGTGKTTLTACLSALNGHKVIADADVDAADLFILLKPEIHFSRAFKAGQVAVIDTELCSRCGACKELCRFEAISETYQVQSIDCEGCGVCGRICPEKAISFQERISGEWYMSHTRFGPFVHARLSPGEENSGKLVALVRHQARLLAEEQGIPWLLVDGPPGIGCPVISAMAGTGAALIVTEPTPSGLHDLRRVAELASHFRLPTAACINKWDLNVCMTAQIEDFCKEKGIIVVARIPYDVRVSLAVVARQILVEYAPQSPVAQEITKMWERLGDLVPEK